MCAKHFGTDPYELKNAGLENPETGVLPPHPKPGTYRTLLYAMADWIEEREHERFRLLIESNGARLIQ